MTPYFQTPDQRATIYCADSIQLLPLLKNIDAIVTDPPYGINYVHNGHGKGFSSSRNKKPIINDEHPFDPTPLLSVCSKYMLFGADHYKQHLPEGGRFYCWDKSCGQGPADNMMDAEFAWSNIKNARCIFRHMWKGCLRAGEGCSSKMTRTHPSQKPVELMMWCLDTIRIGIDKTILDPYMGVGSTGVACLRTGRRFIGIEIDPEYCDIAADRLQKEWQSQQ